MTKYNSTEKREIVYSFKASGLSIRKYAMANSINPSTLHKIVQKHNKSLYAKANDASKSVKGYKDLTNVFGLHVLKADVNSSALVVDKISSSDKEIFGENRELVYTCVSGTEALDCLRKFSDLNVIANHTQTISTNSRILVFEGDYKSSMRYLPHNPTFVKTHYLKGIRLKREKKDDCIIVHRGHYSKNFDLWLDITASANALSKGEEKCIQIVQELIAKYSTTDRPVGAIMYESINFTGSFCVSRAFVKKLHELCRSKKVVIPL